MLKKVIERDLVGGAPDRQHTYEYASIPAASALWHYDDDLFQPTDRQSWADWRGYPGVRTIDGDPADPDNCTVTTSLFYTGMNADRTAGGGTKNVDLTDFDGNVRVDSYSRRGILLQKRSWKNTDNTGEISSTRYTYWDGGVTVNGPGVHNAIMVRLADRQVLVRHRRLDRLECRFDELSSDIPDTGCAPPGWPWPPAPPETRRSARRPAASPRTSPT